jgi:SAM-dependent methyltransferase
LGVLPGEVDLRGNESAYLGGVNVRGKRVLEVGTASGHLAFHLERCGAEVVGYDLGPEDRWDLVPYGGAPDTAFTTARDTHLSRMEAAWWLSHHAHRSHARRACGRADAIPATLGTFDVVTLGCVLLHLRDPFAALQSAAARCGEMLVVTELVVGRRWQLLGRVTSPKIAGRLLALGPPALRFVPDPRRGEPRETWWDLSPAAVTRMVRVLGFGRTTLTFHHQRAGGRQVLHFTVVARR